MQQSRVMVTGFEPFGAWTFNPSGEALGLIARDLPGALTLRLPVDHAAAAARIRAAVAEHRPQTLLLTGLMPDPVLRLETVARPGPLVPWAGGVRAGRWPFAASAAALGAHGLPLRLSADAGRYVCDTTYWAALGTEVPRVVFLHVPPLSPAWPLRRIARAVAICAAAA